MSLIKGAVGVSFRLAEANLKRMLEFHISKDEARMSLDTTKLAERMEKEGGKKKSNLKIECSIKRPPRKKKRMRRLAK